MAYPAVQCSVQLFHHLDDILSRSSFFSHFPVSFFNFSYKVKLKSRLLEISFLIPALCCEVPRTNVSSPQWHSFVPLIFPGPHSPIFIDCISPEHYVIFLFWQKFPLKRFALERDSSFIPLLTFYEVCFIIEMFWYILPLINDKCEVWLCLASTFTVWEEFSMSMPPKTFLL